jgi:hypothetical protein
MAQNKVFNYEPFPISSSTLATIGGILFNIFTSQTPAWVGPVISQPYAIIKHIRVINLLTTIAVPVSLFKAPYSLNTGVSLTTQQFALASVSVPAASYVDWYGQARFDGNVDILLGQTYGTTTSCANIQIDGEIGIS